MRNYNSLIDRYPGADGMKTGFICASGYNVVASATRNGRRLIAVVLGAWSGAVRAQKAAQLLERGFNSAGLSWLTPSLGTVDALAPIDAQPPNLRDEMCGGHRRKPPSEENEEEPEDAAAAATSTGEASNGQQAFMLSGLKPANGKFVLGPARRNDAANSRLHWTCRSSGRDRTDRERLTERRRRKSSPRLTAPKSRPRPKSAAKPAKTAKPAKPVKPKVTSVSQ